jgi:hypothetical protein
MWEKQGAFIPDEVQHFHRDEDVDNPRFGESMVTSVPGVPFHHFGKVKCENIPLF